MNDAAILPAIQSAAKVFLYGPFGAGKTTLAVERVRWLLRQERVRGDSILVLVPQRTLAEPFYAALRGPDARPGAAGGDHDLCQPRPAERRALLAAARPHGRL